MPRKAVAPPLQAGRRKVELASAYAEAFAGIVNDPAGANAPLPDLADPPGNYDLNIWITFAYDRNDREPDGDGVQPPIREGDYVLEGGRIDGQWNLRTSPKGRRADRSARR